jgi:antitoxin (DNA-binding transcriptional repressor) of toxin-antitoxin stability system
MVTMTVTDAVRSFSEVVSRVLYRGESFLLVRGGRPVARLLPTDDRPVLTGSELARLWPTLPHLDPADAEALDRELAEGRAMLGPPEAPAWD